MLSLGPSITLSGGNALNRAIRGLFSSGEVGVWYDPSDLNTMTQDAAGTIAAIVDQPVGRIMDKSGNGFHATQSTSTARPILRQSGSLYYLEFDGVDDFLVTGNVNFTATDKITIFAGWQHNTATAGSLCELSATPTATNGCFRFGGNATSAVFLGLHGTTDVLATGDVRTLPFNRVTTASYDIAAATFDTEMILRSNGVAKVLTLSTGTNAGTGNFSTNAIYIGMRGGLSNPFNGRLYSLIVRGALSDAGQIISAESFVNSKAGAY